MDPAKSPLPTDARQCAPIDGFGLGASLAECRAEAAQDVGRLPESVRRLERSASCPVEVADALTPLAEDVDCRLAQQACP